MVVAPLDITIPGRAALLTHSQNVAEPWRRSVAAAARSNWQGTYIKEPCAVRLTFNLEPARFRDTAIFNLLKATLDGLSHVVFAPSSPRPPTPYHTEDWRIVELHARKRVTHQEPSARIELLPVGSLAAPLVEKPLVDGFVPGSPPLWPGDAAGQRRVLEARSAYVAALQVMQAVGPGASLGIAFRFFIEPQRLQTSDLDNYSIPAAQAACYAIFGERSYSQSIVDLYAAKDAAGSNNALGVQVRVWQA